jgi:hypothetical protein
MWIRRWLGSLSLFPETPACTVIPFSIRLISQPRTVQYPGLIADNVPGGECLVGSAWWGVPGGECPVGSANRERDEAAGERMRRALNARARRF